MQFEPAHKNIPDTPTRSRSPKLPSHSISSTSINAIGDSLSTWSPDSWREKEVHHQIVQYEEKDAPVLESVLGKLGRLPPLVTDGEVWKLRQQLAEVAQGQRFLLQGGDCAEIFDYCEKTQIESKLKVLLQMSLIIIWGGRTAITRIARMAGQYAKPRSSPNETINGNTFPSFRGDNVNGIGLDQRTPNPSRLLDAYFHSAATMNYVRGLLGSGFADLHHPDAWNLDQWKFKHVQNPAIKEDYQRVVNRLEDALDFMRVIGADRDSTSASTNPALANDASFSPTQTVDFFISHEGLLLPYETTLTRSLPSSSPLAAQHTHYNASTHFLWLGDRTRNLSGAHVEYFRGIANPIGVKISSTMKPEELVELLNVLDPFNEVGKVTLISRYGCKKVGQFLPGHIQAVKGTAHKVVWCCDPMHGNTVTTAQGVKTRRFEDIVEELMTTFQIHASNGSRLNGVHFELTGDAVTETVGGSMELTEEDLARNYTSFCDPRLNYEQSLDIAFLIAKYYEGISKKRKLDGGELGNGRGDGQRNVRT
ncbi:hypothetical protein HK097_002249 [Rhizophlyctis rosea]|uniref:Phospho-2-dehydro-3-deoxyheptonate aldolase n=1 Tax=Rhizophlyctis rosea TaxID=64517 RepID=A0AAD5SFK5_9FUNG|nr:hypothetical protein HK097_002249 [Rhizophlyctis rosea]